MKSSLPHFTHLTVQYNFTPYLCNRFVIDQNRKFLNCEISYFRSYLPNGIFKIDRGTKITTKSALSSAPARTSHKTQHVSITQYQRGEIYVHTCSQEVPLFLPYFNKNLNMLILLKIPKNEISRKSVRQQSPSSIMRMDRRRNMKLIVAFRRCFVNEPQYNAD